MISVLILTKNEETNIARCLQSVKWSDDVVVYDSLSSDRTVDIAEGHGARIVQRQFDNWSAHQNWGVQNIAFKYPWVFYLDADEECDEKLRAELLALAEHDSSRAAFRVRRKDYFMGRWIRRSQLYPTWIVRVFRPQKIRYERMVNPIAVVDGEVGDLVGHLIHRPFSHGVSHWFDRHNRYSTFEAHDLLKEVKCRSDWGGVISRDPTRRRKAIKQLAYKIPFRPLLMFMYLFVVRRGFLDGVPGFYYSAMRAAYELMIDVKVKEQRWAIRQNQQEGSATSLREVCA
ncbi:MAG: glycosyltransferase family 2 protein [Pirellulales bacterium]|nr:glycosyltransferase family 2 protein [Pirellulales bacterium]